MNAWECVIGLEVHVQLATQSKLFSPASNCFGGEPNAQAHFIDLGYPGVLPVVNQAAVDLAIKFGCAIDATIHSPCWFERKNYFYPDLPKGYQISQAQRPIVEFGHLKIDMGDRELKVRITRAHLEEDAGKSLHDAFPTQTGIDLNRAGTPLLEIVTEPDLRSAEEAVAVFKYLHRLVRYLGISDGEMSEGSMRCDANVSIRKVGDAKLGTRAEIKNLNSFRFIDRAIQYEVERQIEVLESGRKLTQETRLYDAQKNETRPMRSKEDANDYRYFPDPDLLPIVIAAEHIEKIRQALPEKPQEKYHRYIGELGLSTTDAGYLTEDPKIAWYFEAVNEICKQPKLAANWVLSELLGNLNTRQISIDQCSITAEQFGTLILRIVDNTISGKIAKEVLIQLWDSSEPVDAVIARMGVKQISDGSAIQTFIDQVLAENSTEVEQYKAGDENKQKKLIGFFVGQLMKKSKGQINPQQANELLKKNLS